MGELVEEMKTPAWLRNAGLWLKRGRDRATTPEARIGLALGGGFARGIAHLGVLRALERNGIKISYIAGVSAGSMVAAAYASGTPIDEIEQIARAMKFRDVARWSLSRFGLAHTDRMVRFLKRLLKTDRFEEMKIPLAVVASDLSTGQPVVFRGTGNVTTAVRASCAYPGLFQPVRHEERFLVDGLVSMEVPALPLKDMGATHNISVALPSPETMNPRSIFCVLNRCFQIMAMRTEHEWRRHSNVVIEPRVSSLAWDAFESSCDLIRAGEEATERSISVILEWAKGPKVTTIPLQVQPAAMKPAV
jgi:NTE family protein